MNNPALTIGLAMVLGMLAQVGSKHLGLPGIVLLLLSGIIFGPDVLNWIRPDVRNWVTNTSWLCCGDNPFRGRNESTY